MHNLSLISGIGGLLAMPLMFAFHTPVPFFLGLILGVVAIVTGALSRHQKAGMAGLILGAVLLLGGLSLFFYLRSSPVDSPPPVTVSVPAVR